MMFWANSVPGEGERKWKDPEIGVSLASLRKHQCDWKEERSRILVGEAEKSDPWAQRSPYFILHVLGSH